jgi:hypothetical protein
MTSKIHVAIPNNTKILMDLGAGDLHIGFIEGNYSKNVESHIDKTEYGDHYQTAIEGKRIHWGTSSRMKHGALPFAETKTLQEIYEVEGEFAITSMEVQAPYERKIVTNGVPSTIECIALFFFAAWPFKPKMIRKILDRMPSQKVWERIKQKRVEWIHDEETRKRQRDTWLINKMPEGIPEYVYKLWLDQSFAMILPESIGTFLGRELGTDYKEAF